jgi:metal-responsive CopG/Arc/MetJ family transcriptional regulator
MTNTLATISFKLPKGDLRRIPSRNRSQFIRDAVREKLSKQKTVWKPKTAWGKKLAAMRAAHVASGAKLLTTEEILEEIRERRGGLA